jgi:hypothetical protein
MIDLKVCCLIEETLKGSWTRWQDATGSWSLSRRLPTARQGA